jgi:hypothetical protein
MSSSDTTALLAAAEATATLGAACCSERAVVSLGRFLGGITLTRNPTTNSSTTALHAQSLF